jgi:hypothetical protein
MTFVASSLGPGDSVTSSTKNQLKELTENVVNGAKEKSHESCDTKNDQGQIGRFLAAGPIDFLELGSRFLQVSDNSISLFLAVAFATGLFS